MAAAGRCRLAQPVDVHPRSAPTASVVGTWAPHVTLAMGLNADQVPAAVSLCHGHARNIAGRIEGVGCTEVDTGACDLIVEGQS